MKKVVLGVGMLISGTFGLVGVIIAVFLSNVEYSDWTSALNIVGLDIAFYLFMLLFLIGLIVAIFGALGGRSKRDK